MGEKPDLRIRRRTALVAGGAMAAVAVAGVGWAVTRSGDAALMGDIGPGTVLDRWTVVAVHPATLGGIPVVLATAQGHRYQVDVLARGGPEGVAQTQHLSLYLANQGNGDAATDEEQGLGALALAQAIEQREHGGAPVPALMTLTERHARYPDGAFGVPLQ